MNQPSDDSSSVHRVLKDCYPLGEQEVNREEFAPDLILLNKPFNIRRIRMNSEVLFVLCKYIVFGLQFARGILVAKILGPYFYGVWGFVTLVQQYLQYFNLGLPYAVNVQLATGARKNPEKQKTILGSAIGLTFSIAGLLALTGLGIQAWDVSLFKKYAFNNYAAMVGIAAGLFQVQLLLMFIYRVYGKLARIAISELLSALMLLSVALAFKGESLIVALLCTLILSEIATVIIFMIRAPFKILFSFELKQIRALLIVGIPLLVYNFSYVLITIVARTTISAFYSVETLGYYSLAGGISAIALLGVNAMTWIAFPGLLSKTREGLSDEVVTRTIAKVNDLYITAVLLIVFATILMLPVVFVFLPQYKPAEGALVTLLLSEAVFSMSFAYNCAGQARKKQNVMAAASLMAVLVVAALGLLAAFLKLGFVWVAISVLAGAFVYTMLQVQIGARLFRSNCLQARGFRDILPWSSIGVILIFLVGGLTGYPVVLGGIGLLIFILCNLRQLNQLWRFAAQRLRIA